MPMRVKSLLALGALTLLLIMFLPSESLEKFQEKRGPRMTVTIDLGSVDVFLSATLRMMWAALRAARNLPELRRASSGRR